MLRVAVLIAFLSLLAAPAGAAERRVPHGWLGVTADGPMTAAAAGEWNRMARAGVARVRTAFRWSELQPAPGATDFAASDAIVAAAAQRGIEVLPVVQHVPA